MARTGRNEWVAWLAYLLGLAKRAWSWVGIFAIVGLILLLGLGMPLEFFDRLFFFWKQW